MLLLIRPNQTVSKRRSTRASDERYLSRIFSGVFEELSVFFFSLVLVTLIGTGYMLVTGQTIAWTTLYQTMWETAKGIAAFIMMIISIMHIFRLRRTTSGSNRS